MSVKKFLGELFGIPLKEYSDMNEVPPINIERIAIDQHGYLGSVYDGYTDNLNGGVRNNIRFQSHQLTNVTKCLLIQDCKRDAPNLFKFVDIDDQLRISILLKMISPTGIASFVDYPQLIDKYTRFLYVYHESHIQSYDNRLHELRKLVTSAACETYGTHIITGVVYGVQLLVILQLPPDWEKEIDILLLNMYPSLSNNQHALKMNSEHKALLNKITSIRVCSNITDLNKTGKFSDVYDAMIELQKSDKKYRPIKYILTPIQWFYGRYGASIQTLISCEPAEVQTLQRYLRQQASEFKRLLLYINHDLSESLQGKLHSQLRNIQDRLSTLRILQEEDITRIRSLILDVRYGREPQRSIQNKVSLDPPKEIERLINGINIHAEELQAKIKLIEELQRNGFEYCDVAELGIRGALEEEVVKDLLLGNDCHKAVFFSSDTFRKQNLEGWVMIYSELIEERKNNSRVQLVYADFTYSEYILTAMKIVRLAKPMADNVLLNTISSRSSTKRRAPPPPQSSLANECINILLLGESGVGKSTFINAFANYLRFQSLDEAQQGKPIVIIPVSYVMTINDDFEERIIKFGQVDPNENHNEFGQSVTQQCKSYVFDISKDKKLRIIDTPGFGDTRGDQQDDLNMKEIFSYLNNLTYLNGICLLFKPEVNQLNPYFRVCCTELCDYFGENIRDHFIFCFTNARSTFFAPGNIRPLLNTFFESFPVKHIPFAKGNSFSFDSESFRYLVAIQNSIEFDPSQRSEFEQSWTKSVAESQRFRDFLSKQHPYRKNEQWQSITHAQFQISYMIRPMLEAMRNLLRNMIVSKSNSSIELRPTAIEPSLTICYACNRKTPKKFGHFWILPDHLHPSPNTCSCNAQNPAEYRLGYAFLIDQVDESFDELKKQLQQLSETCAKLFYVLMDNSPAVQEDPFLNGVDRLLSEEQYICDTQTSTDSNKTLIDGLKQFKTKHQEYLNTMKANREQLTLSKIYDLIESVRKVSMVEIQLNAIKEYQQRLVDNNQCAVHVERTDKK